MRRKGKFWMLLRMLGEEVVGFSGKFRFGNLFFYVEWIWRV